MSYATGRYFSLSLKTKKEIIELLRQRSRPYLFSNLIPKYPTIEFGAHLHTTADKWFEKIDAAYNAGCRRYDGAIQGFGGCPMAKDELTGNLATEALLDYLNQHQIENKLNRDEFDTARQISTTIF